MLVHVFALSRKACPGGIYQGGYQLQLHAHGHVFVHHGSLALRCPLLPWCQSQEVSHVLKTRVGEGS